MSANLTFVRNYTGPSDQREASLAVSEVRAHAAHMRYTGKGSYVDDGEVLRDKRDRPTTSRTRRRQQSVASEYDQNQVRNVDGETYDGTAISLNSMALRQTRSPFHLLGHPRTDPFGVLPFEGIPPIMYSLWDYAFSTILPNNMPGLTGADLSQTLIRQRHAAMHDRLTYHCQISHIAHLSRTLLLDDVTRRTIQVIKWEHQNHAVQLLQQALLEIDPKNAPDAIIGAMLMLAVQLSTSAEFLDDSSYTKTPLEKVHNGQHFAFGDLSVPAEHNAWIFLVKQRGGLENINHGLALRCQLCDIANATRSGEEPRFPLLRRTVEKSAIILRTLQTSRVSSMDQRLLAWGIDSDLVNLIHSMRVFAHSLEASEQHLLSTAKLQALSLVSTTLQHRLCSLRYLVSAQSPTAGQSNIKQANVRNELIRTILLIFSDLAFFPNPSCTGLKARLAQESRSFIERSGQWDDSEMTLFVWILTMGGIAGLASDDRQWFVEMFRQYIPAGQLDRQQWHEVTSSILWCEFLMSKPAGILWAEAMNA